LASRTRSSEPTNCSASQSPAGIDALNYDETACGLVDSTYETTNPLVTERERIMHVIEVNGAINQFEVGTAHRAGD
jgi:hypothetical protein